MALVSIDDVLTTLKVAATPGSDLYRQLDKLRRQYEQIIKRWCKWDIEANSGMGYGNFIEYRDGKGYLDCVLRNPYVARVSEVKLTQLGAYGSYNQGFSQATALVNGTDYSLVFENNKNCPSGLLRRLANNLTGIGGGWWPSQGTYERRAGLSYGQGPVWPAGLGNIRVKYDWGFQPSTALTGATWAAGVATFTFGSPIVVRTTDYFTVKDCAPDTWNGDYQVASVSDDSTQVTARIGSDPGAVGTLGTATFIPMDIQYAVCAAVGIARNQVRLGGLLSGEGLGDYNYSLNFDRDASFGTIRQVLGSWRDVSTAIAIA